MWRDSHKRDFIDTILKGYPFPQIFLARGPIDLETMSASQAVVDGQQRLNAILEFVSGNLLVDGKRFRDLSDKVREEFLKYEVAVIDFDLDAGDPRLKDVFHRLNRTYYSLSSIEKLSSEYSASEFMLVARTLCGEIVRDMPEDDKEYFQDIYDSPSEGIFSANAFSKDPGIDDDTWMWMLEHSDGSFSRLMRIKDVFSNFEFDRKVPLMFTLNLMCTFLAGYYHRNDKVRELLEERLMFPEKDELIYHLNDTADYIFEMEIPRDSMWWNKANFFTLVIEIARHPKLRRIPPWVAVDHLLNFSSNVPMDYILAAREGVNGKSNREYRGRVVRELLAEESYPSLNS